jgi:hypothetical protein
MGSVDAGPRAIQRGLLSPRLVLTFAILPLTKGNEWFCYTVRKARTNILRFLRYLFT